MPNLGAATAPSPEGLLVFATDRLCCENWRPTQRWQIACQMRRLDEKGCGKSRYEFGHVHGSPILCGDNSFSTSSSQGRTYEL